MRFTDFRLPISDCHKNRALSEKNFFRGQSGPPIGRTRPVASKDSGLGMAREVTIDAFRQKTFATALTTTGKGGASAFGPHTGPKTVLLLSCALGSL